MEEKNPIQVADRLFQVLETLAKNDPLTLGELQQIIPLNKTTLHRLLASLAYMGYVKQDGVTGKYAPSLKLATLANHMIQHIDILELIRPHMKRLCEETGETVHFVQLEGWEAVYIAKEESLRNTVRMVSRIGSRIPLYCSAVGKALLAHMEPSQVEILWQQSEVRPLTPHTITDYALLCQTLNQVRKQGYAVDNEENELGVRCVAVSLQMAQTLDTPASAALANPLSQYAISVSGPVSRMTEERTSHIASLLLNMKKQFRQQNA
ncbi:MAG: IclR family transcriptional regulator [Firmicutes bacterium]|nr:IclR family transcriptional regulator [Bacillota bacterium]